VGTLTITDNASGSPRTGPLTFEWRQCSGFSIRSGGGRAGNGESWFVNYDYA